MNIFAQLPTSVIDKLIGEWVHCERDRKILHRRIVDGIRIEPLAEEFGLSVRQTKAIISREIKRIYAHV